MPPSSAEKSYSPEESQDLEKYLDIERGDVNQLSQSATQNDPMAVPQQQQQAQASQTSAAKQFDPVEFVRSMISAGFIPSKAQILNSNNNVSGPTDSSNTWFAIFLQRLIRQERFKKNKR